MSNKKTLTVNDINGLCKELVFLMTAVGIETKKEPMKVYPIPRGGIPAAFALSGHMPITFVGDPAEADCFIDDIIDSGKTMNDWCDRYPGKYFFALIDKTDESSGFKDSWVVFPWEGDNESSVEDNIRRILQFAGDNPDREGLLETPARVAKALQFWFKGYAQKPEDVLKVFEDGAENCDEMVIVKDIPFFSKCEHHMADIFGTASIAYIPDGKIVGLSKLSRILDVFARRLQVQERLTNQVADALYTNLGAKGVGVVIKARHMCMESRGVCQQGHHTVTSALRGVMKEQADTRAEFIALVK